MVRNVCKILKNPSVEKSLLKNPSDIEKLIKHHDFPEEGTLSLTRLKVVRDSVEQSSDKQPGCCCKCVKHVCKKCEQTVDCWLKEVDKRERKQVQKELAGRKNEKCESLSVCVSAPLEPTNPQYVCVSHMKIR